jgi:hypothetical protein
VFGVASPGALSPLPSVAFSALLSLSVVTISFASTSRSLGKTRGFQDNHPTERKQHSNA